MKINTKIRYGLRMLVNLAKREEVVSTADLGEEMKVSPKYLRKLAGPLEKGSLIESVQGIYGGYKLAQKPEEITIASIFNAFNETIKIATCINEEGCPLDAECLTRPLWVHLQETIEREFYRINLKNILENDLKITQ